MGRSNPHERVVLLLRGKISEQRENMHHKGETNLKERPANGRGSGGGRQEGSRKRPKSPPRKRSRSKALIWLLFIVILGVVCAVVGYVFVILNGERILNQNLNKLNLDQASVIVDEKGKQVAKLYVLEGNREIAPINEIPKLVKDTFVAVEDKRFYDHSGVDMIGIGRALVKDIMAFSAQEGASTITQQVARNLFLNADKTLFRKGTEASIALALERHKSKDEILELYLNRIYFGAGQYGIKTAAQYYFNKDITSKDPGQQLEVWEIATLAAMPKAPNTYNPVRNPDKSKERRAVVLELMYEQNLISAEERDAAKKVDYDPSKVRKTNQQYQTFVDYVLEEAIDVTGKSEEELLSGGYKIQATIDTKAQQAMEDAFKNDKMFEESKDEVPIQGAMVILDQEDGSLRAMVGGRDYEKQGWNRVTKPRQPGSSFKPIASYGPAIETGQYFPWSILRDDKVCYDNGKYCPTDSNSVKYIGPVTMKDAIKDSRNQPAVWLLNEIGVKKGVEFASRLGIELDPAKDRNLAIALGGLTNGATPLQMARAYAAFANGGYLVDPHSILSITDSRGKVIYEYKTPKRRQVMAPETAYYVTEILQGVVNGGTGTRAKISGRTVAGKTGTTQHGISGLKSSANRDVWFVGYTPELTAAVWMGYDKTDKDHLVRKSSGQAASMFSTVMSKALDGKKKKSFPKPKGIQDKPPMPEVVELNGVYAPDTVSVDLTWTVQNAKEGTVYRVYRKLETDPAFTQLAEPAEPAFSDYAILPDQAYTYYVTAYDPQTKQESEPSASVTVRVDSSLFLPIPSSPEETIPPVDGGMDDGEMGGGAEEGGGANEGDEGEQPEEGGFPSIPIPPQSETPPAQTNPSPDAPPLIPQPNQNPQQSFH